MSICIYRFRSRKGKIYKKKRNARRNAKKNNKNVINKHSLIVTTDKYEDLINQLNIVS